MGRNAPGTAGIIDKTSVCEVYETYEDGAEAHHAARAGGVCCACAIKRTHVFNN